MDLSVCMIVKDEEQTLARCLDCVKGFADEIVIVDTGSKDETKKIAARYTDKVFDFVWCDDFAAARNYSFSLATCGYIMWIDADDVVTEENAKRIAALKEENFDVAFLKYAAAFNGDEPTFVYFRERIVRRSLNLKWEGFVHEAITPRGKILRSEACIFHKKVKPNPPMRNLLIYQRRISSGQKLDARGRYYYGRELFFNGMYEEASAVLSSFVAGDGWVENKVEACRLLHEVCLKTGKMEEAIGWVVRALTLSFPHAEDCCILGGWFEEKNDVRSAIYWYLCAFFSPEMVEDGGFVNLDYSSKIPAERLIKLYEKTGDREAAKCYKSYLAKLCGRNIER